MASKKTQSLPSPFGAKPAAKASPPAETTVKERATPPKAKSGKSYKLTAYPSTARVNGLKAWIGCGAAVVKRESCDVAATVKGLSVAAGATHNSSDEAVNGFVRRAVAKPIAFKRVATIPDVGYVGGQRIDHTLGVYHPRGKEGTPFLLDMTFGPPPAVVYRTESDVDTATFVVDADTYDAVSLIVAPYGNGENVWLRLITKMTKDRPLEALTFAYLTALYDGLKAPDKERDQALLDGLEEIDDVNLLYLKARRLEVLALANKKKLTLKTMEDVFKSATEEVNAFFPL